MYEEGKVTPSLQVVLKDGENTLDIRKKIYTKSKSTDLTISLNGEMPTGIKSKTNVKDACETLDGERWLAEALGVTKEEMYDFYFVGSSRYIPFLQMSDTKRIGVINKISQATNYFRNNSRHKKRVYREKQLFREITSLYHFRHTEYH